MRTLRTTLAAVVVGLVLAAAPGLADPVGVRRAISLTGQYAAVDDMLTGEENLRMIEESVAFLVGEGKTVVYEISVPELERGRLIGRDGRTVRAIRSFVGAAASARGKRVLVRVRD
jgi:predicted RNA-binding protein YlqC (UPF0109 family)